MLRIHQSNRLEVLAAGLSRLMRTEPLPPLEPETVVVGASGTARWLSLVLADELGAAANIAFEFPARYVWRLIARVVPGVPEESPLDPAVLKWRIAAALPRVNAGARHPALARYLEAGEAIAAYQLAERLAAAFDRYLVYRPDWVEAWSRGEAPAGAMHEFWQAALWREVAAGLPAAAREHPRERFLAAIDAREDARAMLPRRMHVFAVDALPPVYLDTFRRIAVHREVHVWLVNPCREYWGLIESSRRVARARAEGLPDAGYRESGNRLLASLGRHGRNLFDLLAEELDEGEFVDPGGSTLLGALQSDILALAERGDEGVPLIAHDPADRSITVQVCHSPMREVEVLHDQLLDRFERDATLRPADVLVLTPDVATYAPYIDAVFGTAPSPRHIPYAIADRPGSGGTEVGRALRAVLALPDGRLEAEAVLALLESPLVARRFGIATQDIASLRAWVRAGAVHWGRDETTRRRLRLPAARSHTWRAGLERLFLGYATAGDGAELFGGALPVPAVEGGDALLLARLSRFAETVFDVEERLRELRTLPGWRDTLLRALDTLFAPGEDETAELIAVREALDLLSRQGEEAGFVERVPLPVVRAHLESALAPSIRGNAFFGGGVTFAALAVSRPIPARLVCLVGMNDGVFPREDRPPGFDLVSERPRKGDRVKREEDRYAFLDAVLAAREALYLSYVGRSIRDNSVLPPSPIVAELLDAARRAHRPDDRDRALAALRVEQPLQPFSEGYGHDGLFTYASEYAEREPRPPAPRFAGRPLAPPDETVPILPLGELARFFANPARHFFERRLGLRLAAAEGPIEPAEPFALAELDGWAADQKAFALLRAGRDRGTVRRILRAGGLLPDGPAGDVALERRLRDVEPIVDILAAAAFLEPLEAEVEVAGRRVAVRLDGITRAGRLAWRVGTVRPQDLVGAWIEHLALAVMAPARVGRTTRMVARTETIVFSPVDTAGERLAELVELFGTGEREPLPFFPKAGLAFAEALRQGEGKAREKAAEAWEKEGDDPYFALAFGDTEPLDRAFETLARRVFEPLLAAVGRDD